MKYPIGIQSFENIRTGGYVYVDKTALVYQLADRGKYYFLSRPRRFGKSLLLSTLEAYFLGKKGLFEGLALSHLEKDWKQYPILHLDLNARNYENVDSLRAELNKHLLMWEEKYGLPTHPSLAPEERFYFVIQRACEQTGEQVVVLVDEYDKYNAENGNTYAKVNRAELSIYQDYIDYDKEEEDDVQRVIALLQSAINGNTNIIVFPEFIMSPKMFKGIKNHLKKLDSAQKSNLFLVLAGTCYHWDKEKGNNILHILNANGVEIGSYYKHSPFLMQAEEKIHGALLQPKEEADLQAQPEQETNSHRQRRYLENCEILSDPGKECTIIDVDVVGRILPAICRDVIDGQTESLSNLFVPSFLVVPAWSQSITSFDTRFLTLANTIHTVSLLCNCCNAVKGIDKKVTGKIVVPQKQGTRMDALPQDITRVKDCTLFCQNHGGCVVQVEISFAKSNPQVNLNTFFPK